ncbi:MAG TPA: hypothetical protein VNS22_27585 [Geminicoccus sp.]|uniref:hypothetical protein n=1 Tax=Geminicoccus sp. TaxID=2024832 RepID=UPI002CFEDC2F|nr:hypothetical protein [Geminicoccus sp.]HWL72122.1 hypothetical protein [Geminicoccus sp.]
MEHKTTAQLLLSIRQKGLSIAAYADQLLAGKAERLVTVKRVDDYDRSLFDIEDGLNFLLTSDEDLAAIRASEGNDHA